MGEGDGADCHWESARHDQAARIVAAPRPGLLRCIADQFISHSGDPTDPGDLCDVADHLARARKTQLSDTPDGQAALSFPYDPCGSSGSLLITARTAGRATTLDRRDGRRIDVMAIGVQEAPRVPCPCRARQDDALRSHVVHQAILVVGGVPSRTELDHHATDLTALLCAEHRRRRQVRSRTADVEANRAPLMITQRHAPCVGLSLSWSRTGDDNRRRSRHESLS